MPISTVEITATVEQQRSIDQQAAFYGTPECPCDGLHSFRIYDANEWSENYPAGSVAVDFNYRYDDGAMGLEITVFDRNGVAIDSQDFG